MEGDRAVLEDQEIDSDASTITHVSDQAPVNNAQVHALIDDAFVFDPNEFA